MNTYRHKNGGGLKVFPAQASPDSFLDKLSSIEGESEVYGSHVTGSALKDSFVAMRSNVSGSAVADSRIIGSTVRNSDLTLSSVVGAHVEGCRLSRCRVSGDEFKDPFAVGVRLEGVTVSGDANLYGPWALELPGAHIHTGSWSEQPRHVLIKGEGEEGIHVAVLECTEGRAHMGCECRPVTHWLERGPALARRFGWSEEQIETCLSFLKSL